MAPNPGPPPRARSRLTPGSVVRTAAARPTAQCPVKVSCSAPRLDVRAPSGVFTAKVLNVVGGGTVMWVVRGAIAVALAMWRRWRALVVFALAELCAELCIGPVKALVDRPRPAGSLVAVTGQSMPSGHVLTAGVTAVALALILTRRGRSRLLAIVAAAAWSILVALSRTYLSAHWLTGVLASLLLGTGWAALWFGVFAPSQRTPYPQIHRLPGP